MDNPARFYCPDCEGQFSAGESVIPHPRYRLDMRDACPSCDRLADDCELIREGERGDYEAYSTSCYASGRDALTDPYFVGGLV